ncbi:MAG: MlaD family protein [Chlamydiota bacterium]
MNDREKNMIIGAFVLAAGLILSAGLFYLNPSVGDAGTSLRVRFTDIGKVSKGTRVNFAGRLVGEVSAIKNLEQPRALTHQYEDHIYPYELLLKLDSSVIVYNSDEISSHTAGLLGEKVIEITPRPLPADEKPTIMNGKVMYSQPQTSVESALEEMTALAGKATKTVNQVTSMLEANAQDLNITMKSIRSSATLLEKMLGDAEEKKLITTMQSASKNLGNFMEEAEGFITLLRKEEFPRKISRLTANLGNITAAIDNPEELKAIVNNISNLSKTLIEWQSRAERSWDLVDATLIDVSQAANNSKLVTDNLLEGKGDLGKLLSDDRLYSQATLIGDKFDILMNDINHYGLLFHLNKGWQRARTKKINGLNDLTSPAEYKYFFQQEFDDISTSLARVSEALKTVQDSHGQNSCDYNKVLDELDQQLKGLQNNLETYQKQIPQPSQP